MLISGFWLIGGFWLVLQVWALRKMQGGWKIAAKIPFFAVLAATAVAILGGLAGANMAPIWLVFTMPLALIWMVALWIVYAIVQLLRR